MELEELKEKWKMLSDEVANQKLVTQKILEKAVNDKIKTMVSDYKYISIILFVLLAVLLWFIISLDFSYKIFTVVILALTVIVGIWGFFTLGKLKKVISPTLSLCEREQYLIQYRKQEKLCYVFMAAIYAPLIILWCIVFDSDRGYQLWYSIVKNAVLFLIPGLLCYKYDRKKMKKIEESFKEYKEFMEELREN